MPQRFLALALGLLACNPGGAGTSVETTAGSTGTTAMAPETGSSGQGTSGMSSGTGAPTTGETTGDATTGGATGSTTGGSSSGASTGAPDERPPLPPGLVVYVTGNDGDADVAPAGPGLILMGGGTDVDAAFEWQAPLVAGGDVVVLRASGADGYNDYLFTDIGGVDSVETMLVTDKALAEDPYVAWTLAHAEAVFIAGGDQAVYMTAWKDTPVEAALMQVWARGGVIGGTSAGLAVLGEFVYAAYNDSVIEDEALLDPYNMYMTLDRDFLALPPLVGVVTDSHFTERRRLCRLIGFVARIVEDGWSAAAIGIGIDEQTALVVGPDAVGHVLGVGQVHVLHSEGPPQVCDPGQALEYAGLDWYTLQSGDTLALPQGLPEGIGAQPLSASGGALTPAYSCKEK